MSKTILIKQHFFNKQPKEPVNFSFRDNDFNLNQLNAEFSTLYQVFISNKSRLNVDSELVLYLHFLCDTLIRYQQSDYVAADSEELLLKKKDIVQFINKKSTLGILEPSDDESGLFDQLGHYTQDFIFTFTSSSKARRLISWALANRSYWNYSRFLANNLIVCLVESGFTDCLQGFNEFMGHHYNLEEFNQVLDKSKNILRFLSFALHDLRFMINLVMMIKHVIQAAINQELSCKKVLVQEIKKRGYIMTSDLAWGIVNLLSNYNQFFNISSLIVVQLNLIFLIVDIILFIAQWSLEATQYSYNLNQLTSQKNQLTSMLELSVINRQIDILNDEWEAQCAYFMINIFAASVIAVAFGATLLLSGSFVFVCLAAASMLGNALYNTSLEYKKYMQATIAIKREDSNGLVIKDEHHPTVLRALEAERDEAESMFWRSLIFNSGFTALIITAAAISWPIACIITISYVGYRLSEGRERERPETENKKASHTIYRLFNLDKPVISEPIQINPVCLSC